MKSILIVAGSFLAYLIAYRTYGRFLARRLFSLNDKNEVPAVAMQDGYDYVPCKLEILFGHHYTSIAGTGPIVGPAIAVIWGWLPALIWVLLGSIFMGAVHDFGALVVSLRNQGKSIGDISASIISPRVRNMFLGIIFLSLLIVVAIFCLVIAVLFDLYPQSVIPIWTEVPIALVLGYCIYQRRMKAVLLLSIIAVALMYITVIIGAYHPIKMPELFGFSPLTSWTIILLLYGGIASLLPIWRLLQPRDYMNSHQLYVAMFLLALGVFVARPQIVAPAVRFAPEGAPPLLPFLFVTIACGAISGFHSLVASGTTSKQVAKETDARCLGYGGMLLEGLLAVFVIISVAAGIGMVREGVELSGVEAWNSRYLSWDAASGLGAKAGAFVDGSANMLVKVGIPFNIAIAVMGVFVASFAGTTLDTATRIQRYVITELARAQGIKFLGRKYVATSIAVISAGALALAKEGGKGGLILWPLFGATNQLLACLALLVVTVYLARNKKPVVFTILPMFFMFIMTGWAMVYNLRNFFRAGAGSIHLFTIGVVIVCLELWIVFESFLVLSKLRREKGR